MAALRTAVAASDAEGMPVVTAARNVTSQKSYVGRRSLATIWSHRASQGVPAQCDPPVPIPPVLGTTIRAHVEGFGIARDGRLFRIYLGLYAYQRSEAELKAEPGADTWASTPDPLAQFGKANADSRCSVPHLGEGVEGGFVGVGEGVEVLLGGAEAAVAEALLDDLEVGAASE